jgi:hypothetical protein
MIPMAALAVASWPKLVVCGGHSRLFDAVRDVVEAAPPTSVVQRSVAPASAGLQQGRTDSPEPSIGGEHDPLTQGHHAVAGHGPFHLDDSAPRPGTRARV